MAAIAINIVQGAITFSVDQWDGINGVVNGTNVPTGGSVSVNNNAQFSFNWSPGSAAYPSNSWLFVANQNGVEECWAIEMNFSGDSGSNTGICSGTIVYSTGQNSIGGSGIVKAIHNGATPVYISNTYAVPYGFSANGLSGGITITP